MRDFDLRALQLKELECLKEIDRLCRKHKIEYFLSWGSAIGAIRHKGFIPWDDDIDVSMKMDDYLRFKEVCAQELDAKYFYQDWESDPYYYSSWAKIRINDTTSVMADMVDYPTHNGICIDIFPLLPYPYAKLDKRDAWLAKLVTFFSSKRLNEYHLGKYFYENDKLKYFTSAFCDFVRDHAYAKLIHSHKHEECNYYLCNGCHIYDVSFPKAIYEESIEVPFEDAMFMINKEYDACLRSYYGDYMQLPPMEQRGGHGNILVDLERDYKTYRSERSSHANEKSAL